MNALDRMVEVPLGGACPAGAPLLHRLVDGELAPQQVRTMQLHLRQCDACRRHRMWLELQGRVLRDAAAPASGILIEGWADALEQRVVSAVREEAGRQIVRWATRQREGSGSDGGRLTRRLQRSLATLRRWNAHCRGRPPSRGRSVDWDSTDEVLAAFAREQGRDWPPLQQARDALRS